jgi:hypothetical protein
MAAFHALESVALHPVCARRQPVRLPARRLGDRGLLLRPSPRPRSSL